jgi:hypothetical protein
MSIPWTEWLGYMASLLVLASLLMNSIIKLRWINLIGCIMFTIYGFSIGALPVALSNFAMAFINIYYLIKIYKSYNLLEMDDESEYLDYFLDYHRDGIKNSMTNYDFKKKENEVGFFILRNLVPAGIFLGTKYDENTLLIDLDFVIPEYRDFKIGQYIYTEQRDFFKKRGFKTIISYPNSESFNNYLMKMGFKKKLDDNKTFYVLEL